MNDEKKQLTNTTIKIAVILRLLIIAVSALMLAYSYSDKYENLLRIAMASSRMTTASSSLIYMISGFLLDAFLTVSWIYRPQFHTGHLTLYIFLGGHFYITYLFDMLNANNDWAGAAIAFVYMPLIWLIGLIPFIVCGIGRRELTKAYAYIGQTTLDKNTEPDSKSDG